jgi:N-methylhydantoinase B
VPAEVMENLTGLVMKRREVRPDSGGPGKFRGGCGQFTTFACRSGHPWSMSGMYDRLKFPAQGLHGGMPGTPGSFVLSDGRRPNPKELLLLDPDNVVESALPGGAGYYDPLQRDPAAVLDDVVNGYVSIEAARSDYGVAIRCHKRPEELVTLPEHFELDEEETSRLHQSRHQPANS